MQDSGDECTEYFGDKPSLQEHHLEDSGKLPLGE
jgi:hypothetical protein